MVPTTVDPVPDATSPDRRMLSAWREGTRTRAEEYRDLSAWIRRVGDGDGSGGPVATGSLHDAIVHHLDEAVAATAPRPKWWQLPRTGARMAAAIGNLDAAEAHLLQLAPPTYLLGRVPGVLNDVRRHLAAEDPRRKELEHIAKNLLVADKGAEDVDGDQDPRLAIVQRERSKIVSAVRAASSAALREQVRLRSFRNVLVATTGAMTVVAGSMIVVGWATPATIPLCFAPEAAGLTTVVCPTEQVGPIASTGTRAQATSDATAGVFAVDEDDIDELLGSTAKRHDIAVVELIGLTSAAIAAAGAIRRVRGSSEPYGIPYILALLKLPTGAVTALLGLLLMRGGFVPGLSALDTSAQILAWAIVFGYAQQLFTRLVDQQAHSVLDSVRGGASIAS